MLIITCRIQSPTYTCISCLYLPFYEFMSTTITSKNNCQAHGHLPDSRVSPWAEGTDLVVSSAENAHYVTLAPRSPAKSQATLRTVLKLEKALQA